MAKTDVFRIVAVTGEGNQQALVFREPVEGLDYEAGQVFTLPGASAMTPNDDGVIPHRELESGDDTLAGQAYLDKYGVTWHFQK